MENTLGIRLAKYRKIKGLSQEELAFKLDVSRQAVSKWERDEASPDTNNLIALAKIYGVSLDDLLYKDPEEVKFKEKKQEETSNEETTNKKMILMNLFQFQKMESMLLMKKMKYM